MARIVLNCRCEPPQSLLVVDGALACGRCHTAMKVSGEPSAAEYSTVRLPSDAKSADAFNRACRSGRVAGARKRGRVWIAACDAWETRSAAPAPMSASARVGARNDVHADVLAGLGARRAS